MCMCNNYPYTRVVWETDTERLIVVPDEDAFYFRDDRDNLGVLALRDGFVSDQTMEADMARWLVKHHPERLLESLMEEYQTSTVLVLSRRGDKWVEIDDIREADGVIFDTDQTRKWSGTPADVIEEVLRSEVEEYNLWASGEGQWMTVWQCRHPQGDWTMKHGVPFLCMLAEEDEAVKIAAEEYPQP